MTYVLTPDIDVDIDIVRLIRNCASPSFSGNSNFHFLVGRYFQHGTTERSFYYICLCTIGKIHLPQWEED